MRGALFDFDGTLSRGYITIEFMKHLYGAGVYPYHYYNQQAKILARFRDGSLPYAEWVEGWGRLWGEGMLGAADDDVRAEAAKFLRAFRKNIPPESLRIVKIVKRKGYRAVVISAGAFEIISPAAATLGIKEVYATRLKFTNGVCVGVSEEMFSPGDKARIIRMLSAKVDMARSIAFGDSLPDVEMLEAAGTAVCLNASTELKLVAGARGWHAFTSKEAAARVAEIA